MTRPRSQSLGWRVAGSVAAVACLGTAACGHPRPHDLSAQGGFWAVDIAGIKIGQTCQSAHARFRSAGWSYSIGAYTSVPEHPELVGGDYSRPGESVSFGCADTLDGPRVSSVQYLPKPGFMDHQQLMAVAFKKLGKPALQFAMMPHWTVYRWGDLGPPAADEIGRGRTKTHADLSIDASDSPGNTYLQVDAGREWLLQQANAIGAAKNAALHRVEKPWLE